MMDSARTQSALRRILVFALPSLVTAARFRNGFVFDDVFVIERGTLIHRLANLPRAFTAHAMVASSQEQAVGKPALDTYRPLSIASFFWDAAVSGKQPWSYHLTNLLLHGLVCVLLLQLLDRLLPHVAPRLRLCVASWFALSPWLAEAHVFINGRSDLLLALFFLVALLAFRAALEHERLTWAGVAGGAMGLALLSKEIAVVLLPFVAAVPCRLNAPWRRRARYGLPLLLALGAYLVARYFALSGLRTHGDSSQLLLALRNLPLLLIDGLVHALAPLPYLLRSLRDDYASVATPWVVLCWLLLVAGGGLLVAGARRHYTLVWSLSLALTALAPAALISTVLWPGFGRYLYVPAIGLCVVCCQGIEALAARWPRLRPVWLASCVLIALASAALLLDTTLSFRDESTLYLDAIRQRPRQAWTHGFMGLGLRRAGKCPEAIGFLNVAANLDPDDPRYAVHLGRCLVDIEAYRAAQGVGERGRKRFHDTRAEPGFLLVEALALPRSAGARRTALLERCLRLDPARSDCAALLAALQREARDEAVPADRD